MSLGIHGIHTARGSLTRPLDNFSDWETLLYHPRRHPPDGRPMPRRAKGPRLYLDPKRKQWAIRDDGGYFGRTGFAKHERVGAEKALSSYIAAKYQPPEGGNDPLIADVLLVYAKEHVPHTRSALNTLYIIDSLSRWFAASRLSDTTAKTCRAYAAGRGSAGARRDLETLRAAIRYYTREHGPCAIAPSIVLPARSASRQRWLTRHECAQLLWAARRTQHLKRFILMSIYTGSRSSVVLKLQWDQINLLKGEMARSRPEMPAHAKKPAPAVRLGRRILSHLRRWQRLDGPHAKYLCHYDGRVLGISRRGRIDNAWAKARARAGLDRDVTPHILRHTRATWLMQAGVPIWEAAGALGMSVETLQRVYGHHHPDWQRQAAEV